MWYLWNDMPNANLHKIWQWCRMSLSSASTVNKLILKSKMADNCWACETHSATSSDIAIFSIFKEAVCHHGFLKLKILTALHFRSVSAWQTCRDRSYHCRDIAIFHVFLEKHKNLLDDRTPIRLNFVSVRDNWKNFFRFSVDMNIHYR